MNIMKKAAGAAVIGYELANTYFKGPADAIDQTILVNQKRYKVIRGPGKKW